MITPYLKITLLLVITLLTSPVTYANHSDGHVDVTVTGLTEQAKKGQIVFNTQCSECHGMNGSGTHKGPPLIHDIYNPGHHSNRAFYAAIKSGVRQHHWPYGDMPPQKNIGFSDMALLIKFIRETQIKNGIETKAHNM